MVVSPQADAQKAVKSVTNQKAIQSQTTSYSRMSDKSAATVEIPTLSQWRRHFPKTQEALAWTELQSPRLRKL